MTPFKKAWDNFKESDEYHESSDPTTIGAKRDKTVYMQNRLNRAFAAGWNAALSERRLAVDGSAEGK